MDKDDKFKYEIIEELGVLSRTEEGWTKELNLISWGEREAKYDLRDWSEDKVKMGKGITLTKEEILALKDLIKDIN